MVKTIKKENKNTSMQTAAIEEWKLGGNKLTTTSTYNTKVKKIYLFLTHKSTDSRLQLIMFTI
jgi:hypothetical protein